MHRKDFIKSTGLTAASLSVLPASKLFAGTADEKIKMVMIGVGLRGQNHLDLLLRRKDLDLQKK
jgi:hypothetical protein